MKYRPWIGFLLLGIGFCISVYGIFAGLWSRDTAAMLWASDFFAVIIWATA